MTDAKPLTFWQRLTIFGITMLLCVSIDQWSKVYAAKHWKGAAPQSYFNDMFRIEYAENHGAFLSLLADFSPQVRFWVLIVGNAAVLLGLAIFLLRARSITLAQFFPLTLLLAGGVGNLIDRIRFQCVIDYFNLGIGNLRTGIFNVADMAITAGFLLMLPFLFQKENTESTATATQQISASPH